jgi:transcriptional regulator with PAS, ATPase and Fis domain
MATAQIENGLIFQERSDSFIFAFHPRAEYLDTLSAGLIAVSRDGEVFSLNRPGVTLLAGLPTDRGSHFNTLFEASFSAAMDGLLRGGLIKIKDRAGSGLFMVCRQIGQRGAVGANRRLSRPPAAVADPEAPNFVCQDTALRRAMTDIAAAVALNMPVHVTGETGTGKELMARHVHDLSKREGEFVALNCGAVPEQLFISEIFGHERGAFTNARDEGSPGLARLADKGTLFLDEVADIPPVAQTALLRFLDSMEVRTIGGQKAHKVDVQIVSATNRNLQEMVAARTFRADLLYRLNAFTVRLPPLNARSDFALIVQHLVQNISPGTAITDAAIAKLSERRWPGNIRELYAVLQRALVRRRMEYVDEDSFEDFMEENDESCEACKPHPLSRQRCREIRAAYHSSDGNVSKTARLLGLSRTTIYKHVRSN